MENATKFPTRIKLIYKFGTLLGLPFPSYMLHSLRKDVSSGSRIYCTLLIAFRLLVYLYTMLSVHNFSRFIILSLFVNAYNSLSLISTLIIIIKRKKIFKAVRNVYLLLWRRKAIIYHIDVYIIAACIATLNVIVTSTVTLYMYESHGEKVDAQTIFGHVLEYHLQKIHVYIHSCLVLISYSMDSLTMLFISILSYEIISSLSDGVRAYRKSLIRKMVNTSDQISVREYILGFRRIVDCVDSVESWIFLEYSVSHNIQCQFVLSDTKRPRNWVKYFQRQLLASIVVSSIVSLVEFIAIAKSGIQLSKEEDALKKLVTYFSERSFLTNEDLTKEKISLPRLHSFSLLANTIRGTTIELTGGGMFALNNAFLLSVVGIMFTYGVLIFQFGRR
ncbi:uncharacterized protein TNIN_418231 [Trichonephila inaurata madagascariensis]|uniref:Gustatory receptor n=1 Tax=Trichonephila inaurata madagascariensis TaxID=2747483 RepID=A0A8X6XVR4_9ARAC|nr:uncharacterized protein TNIN_418231 [Trichonephila inaurata madagascariensis]